MTVRAIEYGVVPNSGVDNSVQLQAAISAAELTVDALELPPGILRLGSAVTVTKPIRIYGVSDNASKLAPDAGTAIAVNGPVGPVLHDFGIGYPSQSAAAPAISITSPTGECAFTRISRVRIQNAYIGIQTLKASHFNFDSLTILDSTLAAIWIENQNAVDSGDGTIVNSEFNNPSVTGATSALIWRSGSGLRYRNNKINMFRYGLNLQLANAANCCDLLFSGNSIEAVGLAGVDSAILVQRLGATGTLHSVSFIDNQINGWAAGVQIPEAGAQWVSMLKASENIIFGRTSAPSSGIIANSIKGAMFRDNIMRSDIAGSRMLNLSSTVTNASVGDNVATGTFVANINNAQLV